MKEIINYFKNINGNSSSGTLISSLDDFTISNNIEYVLDIFITQYISYSDNNIRFNASYDSYRMKDIEIFLQNNNNSADAINFFKVNSNEDLNFIGKNIVSKRIFIPKNYGNYTLYFRSYDNKPPNFTNKYSISIFGVGD